MTIAEIEAALPNGFHDAFLRTLSVDFDARDARLELDFWVGDLDAATEGAREARRHGVLVVRGLVSITIEPPAPSYEFAEEGGVWVVGHVAEGDASAPGGGAVLLDLFAETWGSRLLLGARELELVWGD